MRRKLAIVLSATMIMTSALTGCTKDSGDDSSSSSSSSSKGGKYKTSEELIKAYSEEDHDNFKMDMDLSVNVVMSSDGNEFEMPIALKGDMEVAKDAGHGNMEMSMELMGESQEMSYEMYTVKDGDDTVIYTYDKETDEWTKSSSEGVSMDASAFNEILESGAFKDAELSYKKNEYTMTVSVGDLLDSKDIKDKMSDLTDSSSSMGIDEDMMKELLESASKSDIVYVFDDDLNMTKVSIKDMKFETAIEQDGYSMDLDIKLNLNVECSDFGKIDEKDVEVPDDVVDEAKEGGSDDFGSILDGEDDMDTDDDADDEDDDSDTIVNDDVDRSDFKAGEDVLGSIGGKALTVDSKWDDTFGKAGFEFDSEEEDYSISASCDDYESVYLYIYGLDWEDDIVKAEDVKKEGMGGYSIDVSWADKKPDMSWNGLTWGASAEDIIKEYGEPDYKYEGTMYDSYEYSTLPDMESSIEFYVYHDDEDAPGLQQVYVDFEE